MSSEKIIDKVADSATNVIKTYWFTIVFFSLILIFAGFCIAINKETIIIELCKILLPTLTASIGSYYYGKLKGRKENVKM